MKLRLYLDTRGGSAPYPLRVGITKRGDTAYLTLPVKLMPEQWDSREQRTRKLPIARWPQGPTVTNFIERRRADIENAMLQLEADGRLFRLSAAEARDLILETMAGGRKPTPLAEAFERFSAGHTNARTRQIYGATWKRIAGLYPGAAHLTLEDVSLSWLRQLDRDLERTGTPSQNARNIHFRNIRAVMNWAITEELTENYPFRRFKLRYEPTEKRSLTSAQIRQLIEAPCSGFDAEYRDMFLLIFCLIGINITDLFSLTRDSIRDGRVEYRRAKTGTHYSILLEPEASALLEQYRGRRALLTMADRYKTARDYNQHINAGLKRIIPEEPFSRLSTYWARHSWASIAYNELEAPIDTISAALGHQYGSRITAIYVNPDRRKVDELNRRMLDLVFGSTQ